VACPVGLDLGEHVFVTLEKAERLNDVAAIRALHWLEARVRYVVDVIDFGDEGGEL